MVNQGNITRPGPDDIVVTGMSGTLPGAQNIEEFEKKIYNKEICSTPSIKRNWVCSDLPLNMGFVPEYDKFDAGFFGIHRRQAIEMDPQNRACFEKIIEAIYDAGMHPSEFENTNTGVFLGVCVSESESLHIKYGLTEGSMVATGHIRSVLAQRLSYFLKLKGPSVVIDTACSSSLYALDHALLAIKNGECDQAFVLGANLALHAGQTIQFFRLGVLSPNGVCSPFDENGNGYVRSEAFCAVVLQKAKDARRIYAQLVHSRTNCDGFKEEGITYPSGDTQMTLLREFYDECNISPSSLSYLEAHGTGTRVGDPEECKSIDGVFTKNRDKPLLLGSIKSSIGHSEAVSGLASLIKCILAYENELIAPNINFKNPHKEITGIIEGRMSVVVEKTKFQDDRKLIGINSFGFGGANCHVLLRGFNKDPINNRLQPLDNLPRLVCISGRTPEAVKSILNDVCKNNLDNQQIYLLHHIYRRNFIGHQYKGYIIMSKRGEISSNIAYGNKFLDKPMLCIAFGELNNWYDFIYHFQELPVVKQSLQRIGKILLKKSINLEDAVLNGKIESRAHLDILGQIITHICIADLLKEVITSKTKYLDNFFGRMISSYKDGQITLDEVIEFALVLCDNNKNNDFSEIIANGRHADSKNEFTNENGVEWKRNIQFTRTSKLTASMDKIVNKVFAITQDQIKHPSTSDSILKPSFKNVIKVQQDAVLLEFGNNNIDYEEDTVTRIICQSDFEDFLKNIGSLYQLGYDISLHQLYPKTEFPIIKAPGLHSKILWNHSFEHELTVRFPTIYEKSFTIDVKKPEWSYILGHNIDGRTLFPAAGYLFLSWKVLTKSSRDTKEVPVIFEDCHFIRATALNQKEPVVLKVTVNLNGRFEITEGDAVIVMGKIKEIEDSGSVTKIPYMPTSDDLILNTKDIYKELRLRGYNYSGQFRSIKSYDTTKNVGNISWSGNFISFVDNLFQIKILQGDTRLLYVPTVLAKLEYLPQSHFAIVKSYQSNNETDLPVYCNLKTDVIRSGGLMVQGLQASSIQRKKILSMPVLESYEFVPNIAKLNTDQSVRVNIQILMENMLNTKINALEIVDNDTKLDPVVLSPMIIAALEDQPTIQADLKVFTKQSLPLQGITVENGELNNVSNEYSLIIGTALLRGTPILEKALRAIKSNGFIISREPQTFSPFSITRTDIAVLTVHETEKEILVLFSKASRTSKSIYIPIKEDSEFQWLSQVQFATKNTENTVLYAEGEPLNGLLGFVNCLRREPDIKSNISCFLMLDQARPFHPNDAFYGNQLSKNMAVNIYKNGCWGTYRHLRLDDCENIKNEHCYVNQIVKGDLATLRWLEGPIVAKESQNKFEQDLIKVKYSALNFRDVMLATGKIGADVVATDRLEQECVLGIEFSGIDGSGQRVMGMASQGALSTMVLSDPNLLWPVPNDWSLEEAATVPVVYGTVIYALDVRAKMQSGNSILIHSGVGGVGQAAIRYALHAGCTVFTTVGNHQKKEYLRKLFPQLPLDHIGNSRDLTFEKMVLKKTRGKGVDIVLNSLSEEKLLASVRCLARGGSFLEIGKFDLSKDSALNLLLMKKHCSFHGVMLDKLFNATPAAKYQLVQIIQRGIKNGSVKPLNRTIFGYDEVEKAIRYMAGGKHMGKVLIEVNKTQKDLNRFEGIPRYYCDPNKSYIIIGGLGGFGLELADWLFLRGARNLVLVSRNGIQNGYQKFRVNAWLRFGVTVTISTADVSQQCGCREVIEVAQALGPVGAVFNLAAVLQDSIFENQTVEKFKISLTPKAVTTKYFDEITREMCPELTDFVVFSSVSCGRGNPGQTNYGMANSIMERICEQRRRDGYPALAIEWGAIGEVGLVAEMQIENIEIEISGTLQQRISSCLQVMDLFLRQQSAVIVSSMVVAEKRRKTVTTTLVGAIADVLGIHDLKAVSHNSTLAEIGMDSMTAVEIKQLLESDFEVFLTPKDIRGLTLARLEEIESDKKNPTPQDDSITESKPVETLNLVEVMDGYKEKRIFNQPIVKMPTNIGDDPNAPTVLLLPGLEGFAEIFNPLWKNLKANAYIVQVNYDDVPETIFDMAQQTVHYAERHFSKNKQFFIVAYSYGCIVGLELISILESRGYSGTLVIIDGSPTMFIENMENMFMVLGDNGIDDNIISDVVRTFETSPDLHTLCLAQTRHHTTIADKIKTAKKITKGKLPISMKDLELLIIGMLRRILAARHYTPSYKKIKSNILLVKTTLKQFKCELEDFGLGELCKQNVKIEVFEGDHYTILKNMDLINYINNML